MSSADAITLSSLDLTRFFLALVVLLFTTQSFGYLFHTLRLPKVVGEILGGAILGPSLLGTLSPNVYNAVFNVSRTEGQLISLVSWFGLVLLMFVSGFEIEQSFTHEDRRLATTLVLGATLLPLLAGLLIAQFYNFAPYQGPNGNTVSMTLVIGIAVAVTSIPVISKIFLDLGILDTTFAKIVLAVATVEDVILYAMLAVATGLAGTGTIPTTTIITTILTILGFFALAILAAPRLLRKLTQTRANLVIRSFPARFLLFTCLVGVAIASLLNINIVFGAFLAGIAIGTMPQETFQKAKSQVKAVSLALFTPVYFGVVGLKLDLAHQFDPLLLLAFLSFSTLFKTSGTLVAGRAARLSWLSSLNFAVALNARGGPGIILATIAFDLGLITETLFVVLVLTAIITSLLAGYWFSHALSKGRTLLEKTR